MGVHEKYLDWMYDKVYLDKRTPSYKRLFEVLDSIGRKSIVLVEA